MPMSIKGTSYDRRRDLPRLIRLWPDEAVKLAQTDHPRLLQLLAAALRVERQSSQNRSWTYDLVRHRALVRAWRAETALANALANGSGEPAARSCADGA
jgi:hypothetical protein